MREARLRPWIFYISGHYGGENGMEKQEWQIVKRLRS